MNKNKKIVERFLSTNTPEEVFRLFKKIYPEDKILITEIEPAIANHLLKIMSDGGKYPDYGLRESIKVEKAKR